MDAPFTLPFDAFWKWLNTHPNCIIRAGTPEAIIYDSEDLHWHFTAEEEDARLVQILRGKMLIGELLVDPENVTYVEGVPGEVDEEFAFELILETEADRTVAYFFVLTHGYEEERTFSRTRVH